MEFLRYGSRIPGAYEYGCCAVDIIQDFKQDPDELSSIEVVSGDHGTPLLDLKNNKRFLGPTYRDIFNQRLRIGTFSSDDMPNHVFLAVLTSWQLYTDTGRKWLAILKEAGFEFIRATDNSVYTGERLHGDVDEWGDDDDCEESHPNYIFGLFRNIGQGRITNPFQPPAAWLELSGGVTEVSSIMTEEQQTTLEQDRYTNHRDYWHKIGPVTTLSEEELREKNVPVILAGKFSPNPQEPMERRKAREELEKTQTTSTKKSTTPTWKAL